MDTQNNQMPISDINNIPPLKSIEEKEAEIQKKKKTFDLLMLVVKIGGAILLGSILLGIISAKTKPVTPKYKEKEAPIVIKETPVTPNSPVKLYKSDDLKLSFEYAKEASVSEFTAVDTKKVNKMEIAFAPTTEADTSITEQTITAGYILRISRFTAVTKKIDEVASTKKESYSLNCPSTATISPISTVQIDSIDARTFTVDNCNGNFTLTFVPRFYSYYEINQISKGDIGYIQQYKLATDQILKSIKFFPEDTGPVTPKDPFVTYKDAQYKLAFKHLDYNTKCCDISGPSANFGVGATLLGVFARPETVVNRNTFDGIGLFIATLGEKQTWEDYITNQRQNLTDDYVVVKGTKPLTQEKELKVGDKTGTLLKGYSWKGNDLIYLQLTPVINAQQTFVLVISVKNTTGEGFDRSLQDMLSSFTFTDDKTL